DRSGPNRAIGRAIEGRDSIVGKSVSPGVGSGFKPIVLCANPRDSAVSPTYPDLAGSPDNRINGVIRQSLNINLLNRTMSKPEQSAIPRSKPQARMIIDVDRSTIPARQTRRAEVSGETTGPVTLDDLRTANPQISGSVLEQRGYGETHCRVIQRMDS